MWNYIYKSNKFAAWFPKNKKEKLKSILSSFLKNFYRTWNKVKHVDKKSQANFKILEEIKEVKEIIPLVKEIQQWTFSIENLLNADLIILYLEVGNTFMIPNERIMNDKCYQLMLDLMEISGFIHDNQFDSFEMLQNLLRTESKLIMLLCLELQLYIQGRNERFLIDSPYYYSIRATIKAAFFNGVVIKVMLITI